MKNHVYNIPVFLPQTKNVTNLSHINRKKVKHFKYVFKKHKNIQNILKIVSYYYRTQ